MSKPSGMSTSPATLAGCILALSGTVAAADTELEATSAYSTLDWEEGCVVTDEPAADAPEENWIQLRCNGYGGLPVHAADDDGRISLSYGRQSEKTRQWNSFASFNEAHDTIEWRLRSDGGVLRPFATIHRWFVSTDGNDREVLVVSTVAHEPTDQSCSVGYIDATLSEDANSLAREVADTHAPAFACAKDEARWHGPTDAQTPRH